MEQLNELGFYALAGHSGTPRDLVGEVIDAERLGLGAGSSPSASRPRTPPSFGRRGASSTIGVATAATNHNTRHPLVTARSPPRCTASPGGRFALGFGRGFDPLFDVMGLPRVTMAQLEDVIGILRRLWHGEAVVGHDGPAGGSPTSSRTRPSTRTSRSCWRRWGDPRVRGAGGRRGRPPHLLHRRGAGRSVAAVRRGAEEPGTRPTCGVVGAGHRRRPHRRGAPPASWRAWPRTSRVRRRARGVNGWDPKELARVREADVMTGARASTPPPPSTSARLDELLPASGWPSRPPSPSAARVLDQSPRGPTPSSSTAPRPPSWRRCSRPTGGPARGFAGARQPRR